MSWHDLLTEVIWPATIGGLVAMAILDAQRLRVLVRERAARCRIIHRLSRSGVFLVVAGHHTWIELRALAGYPDWMFSHWFQGVISAVMLVCLAGAAIGVRADDRFPSPTSWMMIPGAVVAAIVTFWIVR